MYKAFPIKELETMHISKGKLAELIGLTCNFDYALPEKWIETQISKVNPSVENPRALIISTTFWVYDKYDLFGRPVSGCIEVGLRD